MWEIEFRMIFRKLSPETRWYYVHGIAGNYFTETYPEYKDYVKNNYIDTGDVEIVDKFLDELSFMRTIFYKNKEILDKWINDQTIKEILDKREIYFLHNNMWREQWQRIDHVTNG